MQARPDRAEMKRGWASLPRNARLGIVIGSVALMAILLSLLGVQASLMGIGDPQETVRTVVRVALDPQSLQDPEVARDYLSLLAWLITVFAVLSSDAILNFVVCIKASSRKEYPEGRDKASWVAGLWAVFLLIQLPTGVPAALAYWWFVVRPAKEPDPSTPGLPRV